jgi:hydroxypyruvate reductase
MQLIQTLHSDAQVIIKRAIEANLPEKSVKNVLRKHNFSGEGNVYVIAIGQAAWSMANVAFCTLGYKLAKGLVVTKYKSSKGDIPNMEIIESGCPEPDENSILAAQKAIDLVQNLKEKDEVLILISAGADSLFEKPLDGITLQDIKDTLEQLTNCGASTEEILTIRKRLSAVKAGRFASMCAPAKVFGVIISDVLGDSLEKIALGISAPDTSTAKDAAAIVKKYKLILSPLILNALAIETPKTIDKLENKIASSNRLFCQSAAEIAEGFAYTVLIATYDLQGEARQVGQMMSAIIKQVGQSKYSLKTPCAIIFGGKTKVSVKGTGKGGPNQELALSCAKEIEGMDNVVLLSLSSTGVDGKTEAAGAIVDGTAATILKSRKLNIEEMLENNDSFAAHKKTNDLIMIGQTDIDVNDMSVILMGTMIKKRVSPILPPPPPIARARTREAGFLYNQKPRPQPSFFLQPKTKT